MGTTEESRKDDKRFFEIVSSNRDEADKAAMEYLRITDSGLLGCEVLNEGARKFVLFGAKSIKYKYFVKPIFKRILTPFLVEILRLAGLDFSVRVSYKEPYVKVSFSGKDEWLFSNNDGDLLYAMEHLVRKYLSHKIIIPDGTKFSVKCFQNSQNKEKYLIDLAEKMKEKLFETDEPQLLDSLSPFDRRLIHQYLNNDPLIQTVSVGEGKYKRIEISKK